MANKPFAADRFIGAESAGDFIANILQASTEYSTTSRSLDRAILRNGGRRCAGIFPRLPRYYGAGAPDRACQRAVSKSAAGDFLRNALMAATDRHSPRKQKRLEQQPVRPPEKIRAHDDGIGFSIMCSTLPQRKMLQSIGSDSESADRVREE